MLVLSRKVNEKIRLVVPPSDKPTVIEATVVDVRGARVRMGLAAPKEVLITRTELGDQPRVADQPEFQTPESAEGIRFA